MSELLAIYAEIVRAASDEQIPVHLENLVKDATALAEAVKSVVEQAKARVTPQ